MMAIATVGLALFGSAGAAQAYEPGAPCTYQGVSYPEGSIVTVYGQERICDSGGWHYYTPPAPQPIPADSLAGKVDAAAKVPAKLPGGIRLSSSLEQKLRSVR